MLNAPGVAAERRKKREREKEKKKEKEEEEKEEEKNRELRHSTPLTTSQGGQNHLRGSEGHQGSYLNILSRRPGSSCRGGSWLIFNRSWAVQGGTTTVYRKD